MHALKEDGRAWRPVQLPPELAAIMRPELPSLADEIIREVREKIPEYARPMEGPYGQMQRAGVQQAFTTFIDLVEDPGAPLDELADTFCKLGELEALEGRSLDSLQAAYRIGFRVAWHRSTEVGERERLPATALSRIGEALFGYLEILSSLSQEGYLKAKARSGSAVEQWRSRLLALILEQPPAPRRAIDELAEIAGWIVPDEVTVVALHPGVQWPASLLLDGDVLVSRDDPRPHLLLPGPLDASRQAITAALEGYPAAVGLTVPLAEAADSLRWARHALALAGAGIIDDGPLTRCGEHMITLWLLADRALTGQISQRLLAGLGDHAGRRQQWATETLAAWLQTWGNTAKIAERLCVHPQTVRYRVRRLEEALGDRLDDPDTRFAMDLVLRANRLRERARPRRERAPGAAHGKGQPAVPGQSAEPPAERAAAAGARPAPVRGPAVSTVPSPGRAPAGRRARPEPPTRVADRQTGLSESRRGPRSEP